LFLTKYIFQDNLNLLELVSQVTE